MAFCKRLIMEARKKRIRGHVFNGLALAVLNWQCGSFQGVSYYQSDGIYNDAPLVQQSTPPTNNTTNPQSNATARPASVQPGQSSYYQNYFQNLSDEYTSTPDTNAVFLDVDGYASATPNNQPWGSQPNKTEIYLIQNRPFNPFFLNRDWGWNRFDFWQFNQPWFGFNNWGWGMQPYWGWAGMQSFYSPFWGGFYGPQPFYNPYRWYRPYRFRSRQFRNFNNGQRGRWNLQPQRYSRVASQRGEKTYRGTNNDGSRATEERKSETRTRNKNTTPSNVRYNVGRNLYSIGYDRIPANLGRVRSSIPAVGNSNALSGASNRAIPNGYSQSRNRSNYGTSSSRTSNSQGRNRTSSRNSNSFKTPTKNYTNNRSYRTPRSSSRSYSSPRSSSGRRSSGGRSGGRNQQSP